MKKIAKNLATKSAVNSTANPAIYVDARIAVGIFFTLTGTILAAFGLSTRDRTDVYIKSLGIDANLWWGLPLLAFGIVMLALGRRAQMKMEKTENRK
jgi:hypothetical protein